jgi:hypothetical protein
MQVPLFAKALAVSGFCFHNPSRPQKVLQLTPYLLPSVLCRVALHLNLTQTLFPQRFKFHGA